MYFQISDWNGCPALLLFHPGRGNALEWKSITGEGLTVLRRCHVGWVGTCQGDLRVILLSSSRSSTSWLVPPSLARPFSGLSPSPLSSQRDLNSVDTISVNALCVLHVPDGICPVRLACTPLLSVSVSLGYLFTMTSSLVLY